MDGLHLCIVSSPYCFREAGLARNKTYWRFPQAATSSHQRLFKSVCTSSITRKKHTALNAVTKSKQFTVQKRVKETTLVDHGRDRTCNLLIPIVSIVVKRLAIGPRGLAVLFQRTNFHEKLRKRVEGAGQEAKHNAMRFVSLKGDGDSKEGPSDQWSENSMSRNRGDDS
jgi:hypothetical protein